MKCDNCLNSRGVISENGLHQVCCLAPKQAIDCLTGKKDQQINIIRMESENEHIGETK